MPDVAPQVSNDAAAVRAKLMEDLASIGTFAEAINKSPRTVARMIARGEIPTVTIASTPYVVISGARESVMSAPKTRHAPVKRGRPAKRAAA